MRELKKHIKLENNYEQLKKGGAKEVIRTVGKSDIFNISYIWLLTNKLSASNNNAIIK